MVRSLGRDDVHLYAPLVLWEINPHNWLIGNSTLAPPITEKLRLTVKTSRHGTYLKIGSMNCAVQHLMSLPTVPSRFRSKTCLTINFAAGTQKPISIQRDTRNNSPTPSANVSTERDAVQARIGGVLNEKNPLKPRVLVSETTPHGFEP